MNVKPSEKKGTGTSNLKIGYAKMELIALNPDKAELEQLYNTELEKDPAYTGEDKNGKSWSLLRFVFKSLFSCYTYFAIR